MLIRSHTFLSQAAPPPTRMATPLYSDPAETKRLKAMADEAARLMPLADMPWTFEGKARLKAMADEALAAAEADNSQAHVTLNKTSAHAYMP